MSVGAIVTASALLASRASAPAPASALRFLGDPALTTPCEPITSRTDTELLERVLVGLCNEHNGLGLSANQVGIFARVFVARVAPISGRANQALETFVNPRVLGRSSDMRRFTYEGCLSIPGFRTNTVRPAWIDLAWSDSSLRLLSTRRFYERDAQIVQHELDHLDGKLIVDGLSRQQRRAAERAVEKYRGKVS